MSNAPSIRRLSIAITAAVAAVTLAIGVTAASLLGWLRPPDAASPPGSPASMSPVEPIAPAVPAETSPAEPAVPAGEMVVPPDDVTLALYDEREHQREHDGEHEHEHEHERQHESDDDD